MLNKDRKRKMKLELKRGKLREKFLVGKKQFCSAPLENRGNMGVSPQISGKVKYLMNYFTYNGGDSAGVAFMTKCIKEQKIKINQKAKSAPNPAISHLKDFFDHKQYIFIFRR